MNTLFLFTIPAFAGTPLFTLASLKKEGSFCNDGLSKWFLGPIEGIEDVTPVDEVTVSIELAGVGGSDTSWLNGLRTRMRNLTPFQISRIVLEWLRHTDLHKKNHSLLLPWGMEEGLIQVYHPPVPDSASIRFLKKNVPIFPGRKFCIVV